MIAKEFVEARWKLLIGAVLAAASGLLAVYLYTLVRNMIAGLDLQQVPTPFRAQISTSLGSFESFAWSQWFQGDGREVLAILAAFLGGGLIAGEVSKGTIFF